MEPSELLEALVGALMALGELGLPNVPKDADSRRAVGAALGNAQVKVERIERYGLAAEDFYERPAKTAASGVEDRRRQTKNALEIGAMSLFSGSSMETCHRDLARAMRALAELIDAERSLIVASEAPRLLIA